MRSIQEIEEVLSNLSNHELRHIGEVIIPSLRSKIPRTDEEWENEVLTNFGLLLTREAFDREVKKLVTATPQEQEAWLRRKAEIKEKKRVDKQDRQRAIEELNQHPLNRRAEEFLNQIEDEQHTDVTHGPIDSNLHVLTLMWWGIETHPEWADDSFVWDESSTYIGLRIHGMGEEPWSPHDVMAMLMMSAESHYDERILHVEDLIYRDTPEDAAFLLIDTLMMNAQALCKEPDAVATEELTRKWLLTEQNPPQILTYTQQENMQIPQKTLWGGRFSTSLTSETVAFTHSIEADTRLIGYDIWGSQVHAIMLERQGIISDTDLREILHWLRKAEEDFQNGNFTLDPNKEDVHMNVESYLIENIGLEFGGKLHTARSRNDQVLVDARLYIRDEILNVKRGISTLCDAFLNISKEHVDTVMPGYTHTQHAQPISLGFWATAYISMFLRDQKRLHAAYELANKNPLGACALAGTTFPIDRHLTTKLLGFDEPQEHALDVISSRDFIAETLFALSLVMANLSRIGEEIVYWTTYEFGIAELDDAYSSGSSIMPQKKNADIAELTRGRTGRVYGALMDLLTNLKGLPLGYNRDFQEDKPPLWEAFDIVKACLGILPNLLNTTQFKTDRMTELVNANFATATELANYLVKEQQISFRESHEIVGWLVGELIKQEKTFLNWELTQSLLKEKDINLPISELKRILDAELAIKNNQSLGGTSPAEVSRMIDSFEEQLNEIAMHIYTRQTQIEEAHKETQRTVDRVLGVPV